MCKSLVRVWWGVIDMTSRQVNDFLLISLPSFLIAWDIPVTIQGRGRFSVPPSTLGCRHLSQRGMEHTCINTKNDDLKPQKSGMHERHFLSIKEAILFGCWWRRPEEKNLSAFHYNRPLGSTSTFKTIMFTFFPLWAWNLKRQPTHIQFEEIVRLSLFKVT